MKTNKANDVVVTEDFSDPAVALGYPPGTELVENHEQLRAEDDAANQAGEDEAADELKELGVPDYNTVNAKEGA